MKIYNWEEVSKHNKNDDCWIVIDGYVYDITNWIPNHPGGDVLAILAGEDASAMFHSCHLKDISLHIEALKIGKLDNYDSNFKTISDKFITTLKFRAINFFIENKIDYRSTGSNIKNILLTSTLLLLCWICMYTSPPWGIIAAIPMGLATCSLIGSFGHERIHGNLNSSLNTNNIKYNITNNLLWGILIPFMPEKYFQYEHIKHHNHPMDPNEDYDIYALKKFLRLSPDSEHLTQHHFQHIYAPFIYGSYIFIQVIVGYISPFFDKRALLKDKGNIVNISMMKITALSFHIAIPVYLTNAWWVIACASLYFFTWQTAIYITSGLPHMTEIKSNNNTTSWSYYICKTTKNLKCGNTFYDWLTGGLNYHLAHHLLPSIPREHLATIEHIVKATCKEFDYPYITYNSFITYYRDHYNYLKILGKPTQLLDKHLIE